MRKVYPYLGIALIGLISCSQPEVAGDAALRENSPTDFMPVGGHAHQFPADSSVKLMFNLVQGADLAQLGENFGWGGSFPASAFVVSPENQGVMLWYCFRSGPDPELFLALEQLREYDAHNLPRLPGSDVLTAPSAILRANASDLGSEDAIRDHLLAETGDMPGLVQVGAAEVGRYITSADSLFDRYRDAQGERYNNYMFGFFSVLHEAAFNDFVASAGPNGYIRYYFGYDERDKPNRIRIILMAVNAKGVNLAIARVMDDPTSMQRSWPPPPEN